MKSARAFAMSLGIRRFAVIAATALLSLLLAGPAAAFNFDIGELSGSADITLGYGLGIRTEKGKTNNPDRPNSKAEHTYEDRGVFSNVVKTTGEFGLEWRNFGGVANATYSYDTMIMDRGTGREGQPFPVDTGLGDDWADNAKEVSGSVLTLLDAYGYGTFWDDRIELRAGKQVINWGENLFFLFDGMAVQSTFNVNNINLPGSEVKEWLLGLPAVFAQLAATETLSLEAYYQWGWEKATFPGVGTFYGDNLLGPGGVEEWGAIRNDNGTRIRGKDDHAGDQGQWGVAARYLIGDAEVGLYYSRFHEKFPLLNFTFHPDDSFTVRQTYLEDTDTFGASIATTLPWGDWSLNAEVAYKPDRPLSTNFANGVINADGTAWEEHDTVNASVHGLLFAGPLFLGIDSQFVALQVGVDYIDGDTDDLAPQLDENLDTSITADNWSWGVAGEWDGTWQAVVPNIDVTLLLFAQYDFAGNSHIWGNFAEDRFQGSATLQADIGSEIATGITYAVKIYDDSTIDNQDSINYFLNYKF